VAAPQILSDALRRLIRQALDRESAGFSEFLAKWLEFLELRGTAPSFDLIHAVPNLNHDTRLPRLLKLMPQLHPFDYAQESETLPRRYLYVRFGSFSTE